MSRQLLHLIDADQVVVAIATVPVRGVTLDPSRKDLERVFGKDRMI